MIIILQFFALCFALGMVYFALLHFKRKELTLQEMVIWAIVWMGLILIVLFPDVMRTFSRTFLFTRLFDLVVIGGLVLCVTMVTKAYFSVRKLEKMVEELLRQDALKNIKKK